MKKLLLSISCLLATGILATAQTTATDFTAVDCSATSHTLFTDLDAGNIIVLVWVMPCGGCISDAKAAFDAVVSFGSSNPGKVHFWLSDDQGNSTCTELRTWAGANGISTLGLTAFDNTGNVIDQLNYGGMGMPHVVVLGGSTHHIYYNQISGSSDGAAITSAINDALSTTGVAAVTNSGNGLKLFPNPAKDMISIGYSIANAAMVSIDVLDVVGKVVKTVAIGKQLPGQHSLDLNFDKTLSSGVYFLRLNTGNATQTAKFIIAD